MDAEILPEEWRWSTLGEVAAPNCRAIVSGPFGSNIGSRFFVDEGVPVIRGNNLTTNMSRFVDTGFVFVTEDKADELGNCDALPGDLVFTAAGSLGQVGLIPVSARYPRYIISNKQLRARLDTHRVDPLFAFYWFASKRMVEYVQQRNTGSSVPLINLSVLRALPLPLPPLAEQRAIAHILGTLDDKIELNRRMNETLEAIARAIFRSWFVDFDPVRAKADGADLGLPPHLADLFPDRFEQSELGEIPAGWRVTRLSDLCSTQYGYTTSGVEAPIGPKLLRVTDINKGNWIEWGAVPYCAIDPEARASYALHLGDLVVARMADPGKSAIIEEEVDSVFASYLVRLKTASLAHSYYVYGFLKSGLYSEYAEGAKSGSVQANMNARVIVGASLVVPPTTVMEQFLRAVRPLRQRLVANVRESHALAALRDALLPKLVSGELRLREANGLAQGKN